MAPAVEVESVKTEIVKTETASPAPQTTGESSVIDPASVTPEEYVCFGTIDKNHPECQQCKFNKQCAEKSGK